MNYRVLLALLGTAFLQPVSAQSWPELPPQPAPVTIEEVKDYWIDHLPRPVKPRRLARGYEQLLRQYRSAVSRGRELIVRLRNGDFDEDATLVALRHNRDFYLKQGALEKAAPFSRELTKMLEARAAIAVAEAAARIPAEPSPSTITQTEVITEEVYVNPEDDCPTPPRKCPPTTPPSNPPHCAIPSKQS